jgi:hypothetical protein
VGEVLTALAEGVDIAATERIFGHRHATITRWLTCAGEYSARQHRHWLHDLHLAHVQCDEIRTRLRSAIGWRTGSKTLSNGTTANRACTAVRVESSLGVASQGRATGCPAHLTIARRRLTALLRARCTVKAQRDTASTEARHRGGEECNDGAFRPGPGT